ncbi:Arc family DNA-binding protein [Mesorhizobium sp. M0895]|uniref:Arc family DNA-binding protein n=1 Tax=Mesorhizobium sp. M0895 TaxID=2957019 RepID=UPI003336395E
MATPKQTDPQFKLRLPAELKSKIDWVSVVNNRSINAEMIARLEDSFDEAVRLPPDLAARVTASATRNMRSLNAEVLQVLNQYFPPEPSVDDLLDELEKVNLWHEKNPDYRSSLFRKLQEVRGRLERGELPETLKLPVFSPEEVERRKRGKTIGERMRQNRLAQQAIIAEVGPDVDALLAAGYLDYVDQARKRTAKNLFEVEQQDKTYEALLALGLAGEEFPNEGEAATVLYHALVADLSVG